MPDDARLLLLRLPRKAGERTSGLFHKTQDTFRFKVEGLRLRVFGFGFRVQGLGFGVSGLGLGVCGFRVWASFASQRSSREREVACRAEQPPR